MGGNHTFVILIYVFVVGGLLVIQLNVQSILLNKNLLGIAIMTSLLAGFPNPLLAVHL